jgi:small subunit ribosomal protein S3
VGQKVHPKGLRIGIVKPWDTRWYANKQNFSALLVEDVKIRQYVKKALFNSGVARIELERTANRVTVTVHTAKPGMVIGKQGQGIADLQKTLETMTGKSVSVNVIEVRVAELDAQLVAENIAQQLEKRIAFRRATKQSIQKAMRMGCKGVRIVVSGRIGGAEIARRERMWEGTVPLHTLRADIDYGFAEASTTYGKIGVKVWMYVGDRAAATAAGQRERNERRERGGDRGGRGGERGGRPGGDRRGPGGPGGGPRRDGGAGPGRPQGGPRPNPANDRAAIAAGPTPVNREGGRS